ncbi:MAG: thioredoxin domain-containing protein, partial [Acidobacteriota bacterium]
MTRQRFPNRLADEPSPYLQQHARNPVDWYPWGEEAQARARTSQRPLFVSIGYSACHWCHVMERESFEDPTVAGFLAEHFVAVKVDREERPDVDAVYMDAVQALTGRGGWPLTVFLTPELEPFFGGTYFPPQRRYGMPSFLEVLQAVAEAWEHRPDEVRSQAAQLAAHLRKAVPAAGDARPDIARAARLALAELERTHDPRWGGFGSAPKFPTASRLFFLLDRAAEGHGQARAMLVRTLDGMAGGGMWDWLGGGFHRYSVDERWLIPHFEKMLYDNALLARAYGAAGTVLGRPDWLVVARRTADYMIGEMQGDEGGFLSSSDADSEGEEGRFFTWTADEVGDALPAGEAEALIRLCGL